VCSTQKQKSFAKRHPQITLSTGHKREDVEKCDEIIREKIIEMFKPIHGKEKLFTFVMKVLATGISGDRIQDRI
jgi:hypothetical protein